MMINGFSNLCKPGTGLRPVHYPYLRTTKPRVATWFEAVSENYMDSEGAPRHMLRAIRTDFPVALHGVGMNLGSAEGVDKRYLARLKALINEIEPFIYSDHLCWSASQGHYSHDLLPLPLTRESLLKVAGNLEQVQDYIGAAIAIENVSYYMTFAGNEYSEWDFIKALLDKTGAKLLLDVNNVYVSAKNLGFDPYVYLDGLPLEKVAQIHLAGFTDLGDILFDTHSKPVWPEVWELFSYVIKQIPHTPFMVEWDEDIPDFPRLEEELGRACDLWNSHHRQEFENAFAATTSKKLNDSDHGDHVPL